MRGQELVQRKVDMSRWDIDHRQIVIEKFIEQMIDPLLQNTKIVLSDPIPNASFDCSGFIESILLRLPLPRIYLYNNHECWTALNACQLLQTLWDFYEDRFPLTGAQFQGFYSQLPRNIQRRLDETYLDIAVLQCHPDDRDALLERIPDLTLDFGVRT